jgi:hypothetical protein
MRNDESISSSCWTEGMRAGARGGGRRTAARGALAAGLCAALSLVGCGPSAGGSAAEPRGGAERLASFPVEVAEEDAEAIDAAFRLETPLYEDPALVAYVTEVGRGLLAARGLDGRHVRFLLLDTPEPNAYAFPTGRIYVTRGLLAALESEAELAAVLAHELSHVECRHGYPALRSYVTNVPGVEHTMDGTSRDALEERQADEAAVAWLATSPYPASALVEVLTTLRGLEAAAGAPAATSNEVAPEVVVRIARAARLADDTPERAWGRERYLERLDGLVVGEDPRRGTVSQGRFVHLVAGLSLALPPNSTHAIANGRLLVTTPDGASAFLLELPKRGGEDLFWRLNADMKQVERLAVGDAEAFVGVSSEAAGARPFALVRAHAHHFALFASGAEPRLREEAALLRTLVTSITTTVPGVGAPEPTRLVVTTARDSSGCPDGADHELTTRLNRSTRAVDRRAHVKCAIPPR